MLPAVIHGRIGVIGIRYAHPSDQDAPALFIFKSLGSVEVKSAVQLMDVIDMQPLFQASGQSHPGDRMHIGIIIALSWDALRAGDQDLLSVQEEEIRTFPHVAKRFIALDANMRLPVMQVTRAKHLHTAMIVQVTASLHHVIDPVFFA